VGYDRLLLDRYEQVNAVALELPYLSGFSSFSSIDEERAEACDRSPPRLNTTAPAREAGSRESAAPMSSPRAISDSAQRRGSSATPMLVATARLMPSRLGSDTRMLAGM
jgi:hypothetical protein